MDDFPKNIFDTDTATLLGDTTPRQQPGAAFATDRDTHLFRTQPPAAIPATDHAASDYTSALRKADGNQFNIAGQENTVDARYYPEKTEAMHNRLGYAANEGIQAPDYSSLSIDPATRAIAKEHFLEGNQSALDSNAWQKISDNPVARVPAMAVTGFHQGIANLPDTFINGAYEGIINDPSGMSIDPVRISEQTDRRALPDKLPGVSHHSFADREKRMFSVCQGAGEKLDEGVLDIR